jgi:hypothetical protein
MLISSTLVHSDLHHSAIRPLPFVYPHVLHLPDPQTLFKKSSAADKSPSPNSEDASPHTEKHVVSAPAKKGLGYYWRMLLRFAFEGTEHNIVLEACGFKQWIGRVAWTLVQGLVIGVLFGFPLWCLAIVILGPIYKVGGVKRVSADSERQFKLTRSRFLREDGQHGQPLGPSDDQARLCCMYTCLSLAEKLPELWTDMDH